MRNLVILIYLQVLTVYSKLILLEKNIFYSDDLKKNGNKINAFKNPFKNEFHSGWKYSWS